MRDPIAADGGEDVEVAGVDEVENDGVQRALAFLKSVGYSVVSLLGGDERPHHWLAPYYELRHLRTLSTPSLWHSANYIYPFWFYFLIFFSFQKISGLNK